MKLKLQIKLKDIVVILIALLLCAVLGYFAFTVQNWWEWLFIVAIVGLMGMQGREYILWR